MINTYSDEVRKKCPLLLFLTAAQQLPFKIKFFLHQIVHRSAATVLQIQIYSLYIYRSKIAGMPSQAWHFLSIWIGCWIFRSMHVNIILYLRNLAFKKQLDTVVEQKIRIWASCASICASFFWLVKNLNIHDNFIKSTNTFMSILCIFLHEEEPDWRDERVTCGSGCRYLD